MVAEAAAALLPLHSCSESWLPSTIFNFPRVCQLQKTRRFLGWRWKLAACMRAVCGGGLVGAVLSKEMVAQHDCETARL